MKSTSERKNTSRRGKKSSPSESRVRNAICVEMTRAAFDTYKANWKEDGFCKEALIKYLNSTGGYLGTVTDITVV